MNRKYRTCIVEQTRFNYIFVAQLHVLYVGPKVLALIAAIIYASVARNELRARQFQFLPLVNLLDVMKVSISLFPFICLYKYGNYGGYQNAILNAILQSSKSDASKISRRCFDLWVITRHKLRSSHLA